MDKIIGYLEEQPGQKSFTRVACACIIAYAVLGTAAILATGLYMYIKHPDAQSLMAIAAASGAHMGGISGVAAGWKVSQKGKETTPDNTINQPA